MLLQAGIHCNSHAMTDVRNNDRSRCTYVASCCNSMHMPIGSSSSSGVSVSVGMAGGSQPLMPWPCHSGPQAPL